MFFDSRSRFYVGTGKELRQKSYDFSHYDLRAMFSWSGATAMLPEDLERYNERSAKRKVASLWLKAWEKLRLQIITKKKRKY